MRVAVPWRGRRRRLTLDVAGRLKPVDELNWDQTVYATTTYSYNARNQITGTVILSVVFSRTGQVTNIRAEQPLCCGLTEKAIAAARQIRFVPATREGNPVSVRMQLEYNFNLY